VIQYNNGLVHSPLFGECSVAGKQLMMRCHNSESSRRLPNSGTTDLRKPLSIQTDNQDIVDSASDADSEYVTCVPSPHTFSLSSLRRDTWSARTVLGAAVGGDPRGCAKKVDLTYIVSAPSWWKLSSASALFCTDTLSSFSQDVTVSLCSQSSYSSSFFSAYCCCLCLSWMNTHYFKMNRVHHRRWHWL